MQTFLLKHIHHVQLAHAAIIYAAGADNGAVVKSYCSTFAANAYIEA